jgi:hypothetical protein
MYGPHSSGWSSDWAQRHAERAERRAQRWAERHARWAEGRELWVERRAARRAQRLAERHAQGMSCGGGVGFRHWWLIFPLLFWGPALFSWFRVVGRSWSVSAGDAWTGVLNFSFVAPLAHLLARILDVSFAEAWVLIALAALIASAAALFALKAGQSRRAD